MDAHLSSHAGEDHAGDALAPALPVAQTHRPHAAPEHHAKPGRTPHPLSLRRDAKTAREEPADCNRLERDPSQPVEVAVRITVFNVRSINLVAQTFEADYTVEASWEDKGMWDEVHSAPRSVAEKESAQAMQTGRLIAEHDATHYFWTPKLVLTNVQREHGTQTQWLVDGLPESESARVMWRINKKSACSFDLALFPFDAQHLYVSLLSNWDAQHVALVRNQVRASVIQSNVDLVIRREYTMCTRNVLFELETLHSSQSSTGKARPSLRMELAILRRPAYWWVNVQLPLFCFTGLSFSLFAVEVTALAARLTISLTLLLILVAYRFAIMDALPRVDYVTALDSYVHTCFLIVFSVSIAATCLAVRAEVSLAELAIMPDNAHVSWADPIFWQASQRIALYALSGTWIVLNALLPVAATALRRVTFRRWMARNHVSCEEWKRMCGKRRGVCALHF